MTSTWSWAFMTKSMMSMDLTDHTPGKDGAQVWTAVGRTIMWIGVVRDLGCCVAATWMSCDTLVEDAYTREAWGIGL